MNLNNISSLNFNKNVALKFKKQGVIRLTNGIKSNNFDTLIYPKNFYLNQISFGKKLSGKELIAFIGEENFSSPEIFEKLKSYGKSTDYSLYDIHLEYYKDLLECQTLDEAKEKYPEFKDTIDAKNINVSNLNRGNIFRIIAENKIEGINLDNLTLEMLKRCYAKLYSTRIKEKYWGLTYPTIAKIAKRLNIKLLNIRYASVAGCQSPEHKSKKSEMLKKQWQDTNSALNSKEHRAKLSQMKKEQWQDPESAFNSEEFKAKKSEIVKGLWQNPQYKAKQQKAKSTDEYRVNKSKMLRELWQDPNSILNSKENRAKLSQMKKEQWQDPESAFNSEAYIAKMSQAQKEHWQDIEYREKMKKTYEAKKIAFERHHEITDMMSQIAESYPMLGAILDKIRHNTELSEMDKKYINAYYKECECAMPGYQKVIGKEQHQILVEWGVMKQC